MEEVIKLFNEIQRTSSLNGKKAIISANKNNELFKKCLIFLLDSNIVTGISKAKISKNVPHNTTLQLHRFEDVIKYLKSNNTGTDIDILTIQDFISRQPKEFREFYEQIITKKFRLGADAKLINKCIPGLIPVFDVMLGTPIDKCKIKNGTWMSISQKLNGNRCVYYNGDFYTRQGKKYSGLDHIKQDIEKITTYSDYVFDGELIYKNAEHLSDSDAFQKGTGIANSKNDAKEELKLVLFDLLPRDEFDNGISSDTYKVRKQKLLSLKEFETENINIVDIFYEGTDQSEIWKWLDYAEENDLEGIMINLDTPYECKRTKALIKVKKFFSCDILCTGIEEGDGRNKNTMGALVCDYKGNKVRIGTGFSDDDRKHFWLHPEDIVDHIVSIKYKEETKNKDGGVSIQFPVYECIRFDKAEPSYN